MVCVRIRADVRGDWHDANCGLFFQPRGQICTGYTSGVDGLTLISTGVHVQVHVRY